MPVTKRKVAAPAVGDGSCTFKSALLPAVKVPPDAVEDVHAASATEKEEAVLVASQTQAALATLVEDWMPAPVVVQREVPALLPWYGEWKAKGKRYAKLLTDRASGRVISR